MAASTDVDAFRALADGSDGSYCSDFSFLDDDAAALRAKLPKKTVKTDEQKRAAKQATDKARKDKLRQELQGLHVGGRGPRLISYLESADFTSWRSCAGVMLPQPGAADHVTVASLRFLTDQVPPISIKKTGRCHLLGLCQCT